MIVLDCQPTNELRRVDSRAIQLDITTLTLRAAFGGARHGGGGGKASAEGARHGAFGGTSVEREKVGAQLGAKGGGGRSGDGVGGGSSANKGVSSHAVGSNGASNGGSHGASHGGYNGTGHGVGTSHGVSGTSGQATDDARDVTLSVWDLGGQIAYAAAQQPYIVPGSLYILAVAAPRASVICDGRSLLMAPDGH